MFFYCNSFQHFSNQFQSYQTIIFDCCLLSVKLSSIGMTTESQVEENLSNSSVLLAEVRHRGLGHSCYSYIDKILSGDSIVVRVDNRFSFFVATIFADLSDSVRYMHLLVQEH